MTARLLIVPGLLLIAILQFSCHKEKEERVLASGNAMKMFTFLADNNAALPQDIICTIGPDTIYAVAFPGTDLKNLKPGFSAEGNIVCVDNLPQVSSETGQDFSTLVAYSITAEDGGVRKYTVKFTDTQLPAVYITTNNVPITSKEEYIPGYLKIRSNPAGDSLYGGPMEIRGRGNSTWEMPKKPYKIKLEKKAGLLGMHDNKQWVLLANYADKSLIRNELAFELSRRVGLAYTPSGKFVDLILNGIYAGNYELVEQIDVDVNKVNISKQPANATELPGITGGYLVEVDGFAYTEAVNFTTPKRMGIRVHYPKDDEISNEQKNYIANHFTEFETRLFATNFSDPLTGYQAYFDLDSYVNWYIVNEVMGNPDIFWSTYMYKDQNNDKLYTGPAWDLDIAANNDERIGDAVHQLMTDVAHEPKTWINRLMLDPAFRLAVRNRWNAIWQDKINSLPELVDLLARQLDESQRKNFQQWNILNQKVYLNLQVAGSYAGEVNYLKSYLAGRISWLDTVFNGSRFD